MTDSTSGYVLPKVWTWDEPSGGQFANINRPIAGPTHDQELPVGKHPFQLYSLATPNGQKVSIMFEELLEKGHTDAEYDAWPIRIGEGDQFGSGFVEVNPNSKIPALVDRSGPEPVRVFESGAILVHLAEKFGELLPASGPARAETLSWLFWQMGSAPFLGGGFGHFFAYAPEKFEYPINRYSMEAKRQFDVLNRRLADHKFIAGSDYSIADIAIWPWYGGVALGRSYQGADTFLATHEYQHVMRWARAIDARPAVQRGRIVNKLSGDESEQLHERHHASDFELRTQDKIFGLAADESIAVKDDAI
jgi:GSH-dependent disulfide-bond oxidoreductase